MVVITVNNHGLWYFMVVITIVKWGYKPTYNVWGPHIVIDCLGRNLQPLRWTDSHMLSRVCSWAKDAARSKLRLGTASHWLSAWSWNLPSGFTKHSLVITLYLEMFTGFNGPFSSMPCVMTRWCHVWWPDGISCWNMFVIETHCRQESGSTWPWNQSICGTLGC